MSAPTPPHDQLPPLRIADELVPRFLNGEATTTADIAFEFDVPISAAQQAVRYARDTLLDEYNVVLPIAHWSDYVLVITTRALDAFLGELPQLRSLQTRQRNSGRRTAAAFALLQSRPLHAQVILEQLEHAYGGVEIALRSVESYMVEKIEEEQ